MSILVSPTPPCDSYSCTGRGYFVSLYLRLPRQECQLGEEGKRRARASDLTNTSSAWRQYVVATVYPQLASLHHLCQPCHVDRKARGEREKLCSSVIDPSALMSFAPEETPDLASYHRRAAIGVRAF